MVTLEERHRRGDLIQAYRVFNRVDDVDPSVWFNMAQPGEGEIPTRHKQGFLNVKRGDGKGDLRKNFWSHRVVLPWNGLPDNVKRAESLNVFKNGIDNLMFKK